MAIWYQADSERQAAAAGNVTVAWPPHMSGDLGFIVAHTSAEAIATPTDWTALTIQEDGTAAAAGSTRITVFWRRATSGAMGTAALATSTLNNVLAWMFTVRGGLASGDPINVQGGDDTNGSAGTGVTVPSITTTVDGCLVIVLSSNGTDTATVQIQTYPGITNATLQTLTRRDHIGGVLGGGAATQSSTGNGGGIVVADGVMVTAGATGTATATLATSSLQARVAFAIAPEPTSAGGIHVNPGMTGGLNG